MNLVNIPEVDVTLGNQSVDGLKEKIRREKIARQTRDKRLKGIRKFMGIGEVRPHVKKKEVRDFLKIAVTNKQKAVEILILKSVVSSSNEKSTSFQILSTLNYGTELSEITSDQRVALIETIADAADEMLSLTGSVTPLYNIYILCKSLSTKLLASMPPKSRRRMLLRIIQEGNANTWLVYFARRIIQYHETGETVLRRFSPWLEKETLDDVRKIMIKKLRSNMSEQYYNGFYPLQFFLSWIQVGNENERNWLRNWVNTHIKTDKEYVRFVEMFTGTATLINGSFPVDEVKIAYIETIESIVKIDGLLGRLGTISMRDSEVGNTALELLGTFEYTLASRKKGLKIASLYR